MQVGLYPLWVSVFMANATIDMSYVFSGAGIGIGNVFGSLITAGARNPSHMKQLFGYAIFGFALTEAIALFGLLVVFFILFT